MVVIDDPTMTAGHDRSDADSHFGVQLADSRPVPLCPLRPASASGAPPAARRMMRSQAQVWLGLAGDPLAPSYPYRDLDGLPLPACNASRRHGVHGARLLLEITVTASSSSAAS